MNFCLNHTLFPSEIFRADVELKEYGSPDKDNTNTKLKLLIDDGMLFRFQLKSLPKNFTTFFINGRSQSSLT